MIRLENLTKDFVKVRAVDGLHLEVPAGQIFGFLGPNGAGKTTTIKLITGILQPTFGQIFINDIDMAEKPRYAKQYIGYVPDQPFLYDRLSAREFIEFQAQLHLIRVSEMKLRIEEIASQLDMSRWLDERIESFSQGMRQKTAMAAALIHNPRLIILDEPLVGLDPKSARIIKDVLRERAHNGSTVFLSTHILPIAQELCQRLAIINHGKLIAEGTFADLKNSGDPDLEAAFLRITEEQIQVQP
ncbi:ABC transporter ATP-binding protein [bacterium]|nr:ABC transporter ATP-binding protein [bacterium]MBU1880407.1 ABC transporter ATP-binding protein [bacterium]